MKLFNNEPFALFRFGICFIADLRVTTGGLIGRFLHGTMLELIGHENGQTCRILRKRSFFKRPLWLIEMPQLRMQAERWRSDIGESSLSRSRRHASHLPSSGTSAAHCNARRWFAHRKVLSSVWCPGVDCSSAGGLP